MWKVPIVPRDAGARMRARIAQCPVRADLCPRTRARAVLVKRVCGSARVFHARGPIRQTARKTLIDAETFRFSEGSCVGGETGATAGFRPRLFPSFMFASLYQSIARFPRPHICGNRQPRLRLNIRPNLFNDINDVELLLDSWQVRLLPRRAIIYR